MRINLETDVANALMNSMDIVLKSQGLNAHDLVNAVRTSIEEGFRNEQQEELDKKIIEATSFKDSK